MQGAKRASIVSVENLPARMSGLPKCKVLFAYIPSRDGTYSQSGMICLIY